MVKFIHPGAIDSSFLVFHLLAAPSVAYFMALPFQEFGRLPAALFILIFWFYIWIFWYWVRQLDDTDHIFAFYLIGLVAIPFVGGIILNLLRGPLQASGVPIIHGFGIFDWQVLTVKAYPAVLIGYGFWTYFFSIYLALGLEFIYGLVKPLLPKWISRPILVLDRKLDRSGISFSNDMLMDETKGLIAGVLVFIFLTTVAYSIVA